VPTAVLVHGGFHGGWCWQRVAAPLRAAGWTVHTPSLPGAGEHAHLLTAATTLADRVTAVVRLVELEDLRDVVLVGHSAGGMVTTGVADRLPDRVRHLLYLDAVVPLPGQSHLDVLDQGEPDDVVARRRARRAQPGFPGERWRLTPDRSRAADLGVEDPADRAWVDARMTDDSLAVWAEPLAFGPSAVPRTYVRATRWAQPFADHLLARAAADPAWRTVSLDVGHDLMVTAPDAVVGLVRAVG